MQSNRFATATGPQGGMIARFTEDLRQDRLGGAVVLEGIRVHRLQLGQALARQLGYRVNLGAVASKYIGETEKNLAQLFARANTSGNILFFDEADALFGSHSDVKDSHDRYANLFNRIVSFRGLVVVGVNNRHTVPSHLLERCKILRASDYWPPW
jgi:hypothetical protein